MDESESKDATTSQSTKVDTEKSTKISRRDFLKIGSAVAAALAANEVAKRIPQVLRP
jgi:hypothetical protein